MAKIPPSTAERVVSAAIHITANICASSGVGIHDCTSYQRLMLSILPIIFHICFTYGVPIEDNVIC